MNIKVEAFFEKISPFINKISGNIYLKAISSGMMLALPITLTGAFAGLFKGLPIPKYQEFLASSGIGNFLQLPVTFTTNFLAVIFVFCIAYSLAEKLKEKGAVPGLLALVSFFIITPYQSVTEGWTTKVSIPMDWLGSTGIFSGIIVALLTARIYVFLIKKGITIKLPESVPEFVKDSFASLIPGMIIIPIFIIVAAMFSKTSYGNVHQLIYTVLQTPLQSLSGNIGALIVVALVSQVLWAFGIHGSMVAFSVMMPIWMALDGAQLAAFSAGQPLPNIVGGAFFIVYTFAGSVVGLNLLMLRAKSNKNRMLGKLAIVPTLFGITEPLIFGLPLVLNPIYAVPFILGNVVSLILAYAATVTHLIPAPAGVMAYSMPLFIQGMMQGSWKIAVFQLFLVLVSVVIWYPFFKIEDKKAYEEETSLEAAE